MSAYDWIRCPKGCKGLDNENVTVRVDLSWDLNEDKAYIKMKLECQVCGLLIELKDEKKATKVVKEITFET